MLCTRRRRSAPARTDTSLDLVGPQAAPVEAPAVVVSPVPRAGAPSDVSDRTRRMCGADGGAAVTPRE